MREYSHALKQASIKSTRRFLMIKNLSELFQIFLVVYVLFCLFFAGAGMVSYLRDHAERKATP